MTASPPCVRGRRLRPSVVVLGVAVTLSSGTWIVGVPELVRSTLGRGAGSFSLVAASYALGSICAGAALARWPVRRKARASMLAWTLYLPAYALFAFAGSLGSRWRPGSWRESGRARRGC